MMKAVAYYRSCPGEPEASDLALRLQREAVQREVEEHHLDLAAEFAEREGEKGSETWPAYAAAVRAALAQGPEEDLIDVALVATYAAIGTGEPFEEPHLEGTHKLLHFEIGTRSIPTLPRIALPAGAPGPLCLYADYSPRQVQTLVHLCNAGPKPAGRGHGRDQRQQRARVPCLGVGRTRGGGGQRPRAAMGRGPAGHVRAVELALPPVLGRWQPPARDLHRRGRAALDDQGTRPDTERLVHVGEPGAGLGDLRSCVPRRSGRSRRATRRGFLMSGCCATRRPPSCRG